MNQLFLRNSIYFFIAFFIAGSQNIIPQLFYNKNYAVEKAWLLSITLIVSTLFSILGMIFSQKKMKQMRIWSGIIMVVSVSSFCTMFFTKNAGVFISSMCIASFGINYLYNYFDHKFLGVTNSHHMSKHFQMILICQIIGFMTAPLFFFNF